MQLAVSMSQGKVQGAHLELGSAPVGTRHFPLGCCAAAGCLIVPGYAAAA